MYEIFTYEVVKGRLLRESYSWERAFTVIEKVITISDIILTYPINFYRDNQASTSIYIFNRNYIYYICSLSNGKEFGIKVLKPENIIDMSLSVGEDDDDVSLTMVLNNENIVLSSKDNTNRYHSYKYAEALVEITTIYSR